MDTQMDNLNKFDIAYTYIQACQVQECYEEKLNEALGLFCPDNTVFSLSDHLHTPYQNLVKSIIGEDAFEWICWWQYECDYGKEAMDFVIDNTEYTTDNMTTFKFLEIACGFTKSNIS